MGQTGIKILLVEDEPSLRIVALRQFDVIGYSVTKTVDNGLSAVEMAKQIDFDFIFMDIRLPGAVDGLEATRLIRKAGKNAVIIGLTSQSEEPCWEESGMDDFLVKPLLLEPLQRALVKWAKKSHETIMTNSSITDKLKTSAEDLSVLKDKIERLRKAAGID